MLGRFIATATRFIPRSLLQRVATGGGKVIALFYRGGNYLDPIDGYGYRKLLPYGRTEKRQNALAPASLSLERHRLIWLYLQREVQVERKKMRLLHVAPERCLQKRIRQIEGISYISADLVSPWADVHCDLQALPFADSEFDLILCNHVLEHIPNDRLAMREIKRVLKPGGQAMLLVPIDTAREATLEDPEINTPQLREKFYHQRDHLRLYGLDYPERLKEEGFEVEVLNYYQSLTPYEQRLYALRDNEPLFIATKSVS